MANTIVQCDSCEARLKVPAEKTAVRCPKCGEKVRVPAAKKREEIEELEELEEIEPVRSKRRTRRDDDDEDEDTSPRRNRRRRDDDEDEDDYDDRPRKRRKRASKQEGDGPWVLAAAAVPVCFLITFGGAFLFNGTGGLPAGQDGPGGKIAGLSIGLIASCVLVPMGIMGVKNRRAYGKWGIEVEGGMGVALGMIQAIMGGVVAGICLYGLIFALVNGR